MVQAVIKQWKGAYRPTGLSRLDASLRGLGLPRGGLTSVFACSELSGMLVLARAVGAAHRRGEKTVLVLPRGAWLPETARKVMRFSDALVLSVEPSAFVGVLEEFVVRRFGLIAAAIPEDWNERPSSWRIRRLMRSVFENRNSLLVLLDKQSASDEESVSGIFFNWSSAVIDVRLMTSLKDSFASLMVIYQKRGLYPLRVQSEEPLFLA